MGLLICSPHVRLPVPLTPLFIHYIIYPPIPPPCHRPTYPILPPSLPPIRPFTHFFHPPIYPCRQFIHPSNCLQISPTNPTVHISVPPTHPPTFMCPSHPPTRPPNRLPIPPTYPSTPSYMITSSNGQRGVSVSGGLYKGAHVPLTPFSAFEQFCSLKRTIKPADTVHADTWTRRLMVGMNYVHLSARII